MNSLLPTLPGKAPLLQIDGLSVSFKTARGEVKAAQNVCLDLREGETLALVGETGCGKSVVASAIIQLLPGNALVQGRATFAGRDLLSLSEREMAGIRGCDIVMVFQNPSLALNPIMRVGEQVAEPLQIHQGLSSQRAIEAAEEALRRLGLVSSEAAGMYPFQLSGGMNQRVMIAASMIVSPRIIIADEPSKGLDGELIREVAGELARFKDEMGASLLLITHDILLAKEISDRMAVMYCGEIVEAGRCSEVFEAPLHPYTRALFDCLPERGFQPIPGSSPSMIDPPAGCRFSPRCQKRMEKCRRRPEMIQIKGGEDGKDREVRCWLY